MRALAKKGEVKIETFHCNALFKWNRGQIYKKKQQVFGVHRQAGGYSHFWVKKEILTYGQTAPNLYT